MKTLMINFYSCMFFFTVGMSTIPRGQAGVGVMDCPDDYIGIDGVRLCGDKFNDGTLTNNASVNAPVTGLINRLTILSNLYKTFT